MSEENHRPKTSAQEIGGRCVSFAEFRQIVAQELCVDEEQVIPDASFVEDLLADSIQLVELMLSMEEKGILIPIEEAWNVQTVGDAYGVYREHAGLGSEG